MSFGCFRRLLRNQLKPPALLGVLSFWLLASIACMWDKLTVQETVSARWPDVGFGRYRQDKDGLTVSVGSGCPVGGRIGCFWC